MTVSAGTEGFRSPEQRSGPSRITATADLWSLSALTVWLISGEPPRLGASSQEAVAAAALPDTLADALDSGLATDPADRPADVRAWLARVKDALEPPPPVRLASPPAAATVRTDRARSRVARRVVGPLAGLLVSVLLAVAVSSLGGGPDVTTGADGQVRTEQRDGDVRLAIVGPAEAAVGETVTFTAEAAGVDEWVWVDPGGGVHRGAAIDVTPTSTGNATLRLVGLRAGGPSVDVAHRLRVVDTGSALGEPRG